MNTKEIFNAKAEHYTASKTNPWDKLRYDLWTANIGKHAPENELRVLDVGGGDGLDSVIWARRGHKVTLLDTSSKMLEQARKRVEAEKLSHSVVFLEQDLLTHSSLDQSFDLVLCHNLLPYLDDIEGPLERLKSALKPDGLLSVVCLNRYSEPFRQAVQQQDVEAALRTLDETTYTTAAFGIPITLFTADEVVLAANAQGLELAAQYGVRCVNDYIPNEAKRDYEAVLRLELALTNRHPYYLLARFFQLILKRKG